MVIVDAVESNSVMDKIDQDIANEPTQAEVERRLIEKDFGEVVCNDTIFTTSTGFMRRGFYMDGYLKANLDNFFIKAVKKKFDGVLLITGIEGAAKSTNAFSIAKYLDPSFPGKPLNDGTTRRTCERIVFTGQQFMQAIDNAKKQQAIVLDEAILAFMAQDAGSEIQKLLIKKMVTIRKLNLYILIVLPSIFLLRKYMAIFRTRALIHFYTPDGLTRGFGKVYSYETKRKLYIRGIKEFDQDCVQPDFIIRSTDTSGFFFDEKEYDDKKNETIKSITQGKEKNKDTLNKTHQKMKDRADTLVYIIHKINVAKNSKWKASDTADLLSVGGLNISTGVVTKNVKDTEFRLQQEAKAIERGKDPNDSIV